MANVLIIDDDKLIRSSMGSVVKRLGHEPFLAATLSDGLEKACSEDFDVVYLDVRMPDGNGLEALPQIRQTSSTPEVIIITGAGDPDGAQLAIENGAWDYIEKPVSVNQMSLPLKSALQYRKERQARQHKSALIIEGVSGKGARMKACLDLLAQAAGSSANVLITGETGAGKELFASAIHTNSDRAKRPFIVVDCATLPATLIESMLFGHEKGAFTGAEKYHEGLIKQADKGSLFLDEIGELPLQLQKSFLRALQERRFRPIGGKQEVESDFRLLAATNKNLDDMVKKNEFRNDLLFRLKTLTIELPPLRERKEDIKDFMVYHISNICERYGIGAKGYAPEFYDVALAYSWPGNIRELVNTLESAIIAALFEPTLFPKHLPKEIRVQVARASLSKPVSEATNPNLPTFHEYRNAQEQRYLKSLMNATQGNIEQACRVSGLSRSRIYALLQKHKLTPREQPTSE